MRRAVLALLVSCGAGRVDVDAGQLDAAADVDAADVDAGQLDAAADVDAADVDAGDCILPNGHGDNLCGGCATLEAVPMQPCGEPECYWQCVSPNEVDCVC
jgi:hypothetical protein